MAQQDVAKQEQEYFTLDRRELEIVAYIGDFRIVGIGHFGALRRAGSQRPSDYLRHFNEARLTLSDVRIYGRGTHELLEKAPFVIVNMDKIDFIYARDEQQPEGS